MSNSTQNDIEKYQKRIERILGVSSDRTRTYKFSSYKTIDGRNVEGKTVTAMIPTNSKVKKLLTLLADARREVISKVEKIGRYKTESGTYSEAELDKSLAIEFGYNRALDDVLATLRKEEGI